jgi:two-component system OmpR family sensor kinase
LSWLVVGWAMNILLKRLKILADDIGERSVTAARPISLAGIPIEVAPLVKSMNGLIERLQTALAAQKRFVADAAHELRTPLAAMQIQVDALASSAPATFDERRDALAKGVKRAGDLVGQLLKLARLDEPAAKPGEAIELGPLLLECVGDHIARAEGKGIDLGVNLIVPTTIHGTSEDIRILFGNLIDNAVRYTPEGGTIDVSLFSDQGVSVVEVRDSGTGLPENAGARIFERFFRAAPAGVDGAGLGLAIALRIAERNGFRLTVENRADGHCGVVARVSMLVG